MITIKDRLAELSQKAYADDDSVSETERSEAQHLCSSLWNSTVGQALHKAEMERTEVKLSSYKLASEVAEKQRELDRAKAALDVADLTISALENLPSPL